MWGWIPQYGHTVFFWSTLVAAVFGGVGIGATFISAMVAYELSEWASRDANERISNTESAAKRDIETARAEADAKIGVAREEAKTEAEKAQVEIARARERTAALEREAAEAKRETERIKGVVAWRTLSETQSAKLIGALSAMKGSVNFRFTDGDPEAMYVAIQFQKIFTKAGWSAGLGGYKFFGAIAFGIILTEGANPEVNSIAAAFREANIPAARGPIPPGGGFMTQEIEGAPIILIGSRPPPALP